MTPQRPAPQPHDSSQDPLSASSASQDWPSATPAGQDWPSAPAGQDWPSAPPAGQDWSNVSASGPHHLKTPLASSAYRTPQSGLSAPGKSYAVAWALSLFLGVWGVDRFYLGRWKTGLLKLITMGGFFVWYLIDLVLLLTGTVRDAKGRPLQQFETAKWPSRVISAVAVASVFALFALAGSIDTPTPPEPESQVAAPAAEAKDLQAPVEETAEPVEDPTTEAAPTTTNAPDPTPTTTEPAPTTDAVIAADGTALAMLAGLEEKGRAPKTDYDRDSFGWRNDVDHNGCDTRNDILRRDLEDITLKGGTKGCVVQLGTLESPYSGDSVAFDRDDNSIDIDHVVALSDAWQTGAFAWDETTRAAFANDPLNLLAVESSLNRQKSDSDAASWLPPKKDYRCEYVGRQIAVKDKYDLWVKPAEADAMEGVLADCDGFAAIADDDTLLWPAAGEGDVIATQEEPAPAPSPEPEPAPAPAPKPAKATTPSSGSGSSSGSRSGSSSEGSGSSSGGSVYYKNCDAARAAGAAPVHSGDPGYAKHLDRDGDGVGCE
ncbi:GmrSD restriction endonuclease domain-containing protein [Brachybacterium alimentarium]|uniref:GmrSD restriction endonuclease domain-containing protein n=1 Tax=Brachybacterium alimentarium TaxID=47845 RepID=UPI003FD5D375